MKELLKVLDSKGGTILEKDLAGIGHPLMVVGGDALSIVDTAPAGANVIGALVRDEDGWTLVSSSPDRLVTSGPKSAGDMHLVAGIACVLGGYTFLLDRDIAKAGLVIVWRYGTSSFAADPLMQGRNIVAVSDEGKITVNPAIVGQALCEMYPEGTGVEIVSGKESGDRLKVDPGMVFSVGSFQGMVLSAEDASLAVKSGSPFSWPARGTKNSLMAAALVIGVLVLFGAVLNKKAAKLEAEVAGPRGAVMVQRSDADVTPVTTENDEAELVFEFTFFRTIPLVLNASPSTTTLDLIKRGEQFENSEQIKGYVKFLKDVDAIQNAILKGEWDSLDGIIAGVDREMFNICDGNTFLADAEEISKFVTKTIPKFLSGVSKMKPDEFTKSADELSTSFEGMKDNIFMSGEVVRREHDAAEERWTALTAYIHARDAYLSNENDTGAALLEAWAVLVDVFDEEETTFAEMVKQERKLLADAVIARSERVKDVALVRLCDLGAAVDVDPATLAAWRDRAAKAQKGIEKRYRELYSDYRMRAAVSPDAPETLAVLDAMIGLGFTENNFHQWALREKDRIATARSKKEESK